MGQYFRAVILASDKKTVLKWVKSYDYDNGAKLMEHSWVKNKFVGAFESLILGNPQIVAWAGDYTEKIEGEAVNIYDKCCEETQVKPDGAVVKAKYVVNHTTKQFLDKSKVPAVDGWRIHPLPLLTCIGNGKGGGDFYGKDEQKLVGLWACNLISIETKKPEGFVELIFDLV